MPLTFVSQTIPGTTLAVFADSAEPQLRRLKLFELEGEIEISGATGGRQIAVSHLLHNGYSRHSDLVAALRRIDDLISRNGRLVYSTGSGSSLQRWQFDAATFERFAMLAQPGQDAPGPLRDVAGTLDGGWFLGLMLHFHQLAR